MKCNADGISRLRIRCPDKAKARYLFDELIPDRQPVVLIERFNLVVDTEKGTCGFLVERLSTVFYQEVEDGGSGRAYQCRS